MSDFEERLGLTVKIEKRIKDFFSNDVVQEFGCSKIINPGTEIFKFLSTPEINKMPSGMIIKFAPDFILLKKAQPQRIYFLDVKHSVSPIYAKSRLKLMKQQSSKKNSSGETLEISDVGVVAREALLAYRRYYPGTIILMASPYNSKKLMAQFAEKVECLYCYRSTEPGYDCNNCPVKNGDFFDIERVNTSTGSQTPTTNVDLRSFENAKDFFDRLEININESVLREIEQIIINEPISFDDKVSLSRKDEILHSLVSSGCSWVGNQISSKTSLSRKDGIPHSLVSNDSSCVGSQISSKVYIVKGNDFIHFDKNCNCIKNYKYNIISCDSIQEANSYGKKIICKFCGNKK